ncbi:pilus assembly protein [Acidithiobacillus sp. HP-6]|uniref:Flp family type IVb pilin n=1 Tax=unclassified Acidithiobacillus TaxID=2614800 RepID=UPI0018795F6E|nr:MULTISPECIES: pilus assembly protein [unclassified Acidithiobacillus]MBE7561579.1 pilus assembly protein [Acidithiobacillus sp. HP-6]MBE7570250.1 pilus assembly protein [Acidithiobacillus sp. HP-2]MDD2749339.1 pilus assembly protein [Acidithiobacillus sp.]MDD5280219.1 pilus assembly protein [Acidithiobacillus sp.]
MKHNLSTSNQQKEYGQGMTEYLIIVALIAITGIAVFSYFGQTLRHQMAGISQELSGKSGGTEITAAQGTAGQATGNAAIQKNMSDYKSDLGK